MLRAGHLLPTFRDEHHLPVEVVSKPLTPLYLKTFPPCGGNDGVPVLLNQT